MFDVLFEHLARFVRITEQERDLLLAKLRYKKIAKKEFLLKQGQICSGNFFVLSGCVRLYSITDNGTEQIWLPVAGCRLPGLALRRPRQIIGMLKYKNR